MKLSLCYAGLYGLIDICPPWIFPNHSPALGSWKVYRSSSYTIGILGPFSGWCSTGMCISVVALEKYPAQKLNVLFPKIRREALARNSLRSMRACVYVCVCVCVCVCVEV